jgi:sec-independent protein translocase protein TatA
MFGLGQWEILLILLVVLLLFGAKRIPEMAQGLGKGIKEFRTAMRDVQQEVEISPNSPDAGPSIGGTVANQPPPPAAAVADAPPAQPATPAESANEGKSHS